MIKSRVWILLLMICLLPTAACSGGAPIVEDLLDGTSWELSAYRETSPLPGTTINASFAEGHVRGSAGCNHYKATYRIDGERITIGEVELTAMACLTPEGAMDQEQEFVRFLAAAQTFKLADGQLQLLRQDGDALTFISPDAGPSDALDGTSWQLMAFGQEQPIPGTTITVAFKEGQMRGSAGCNSFFGAYTLKGDQIAISEIGMTEMACLDPQGVMDQELIFLQYLSNARRVRLTGGELQIFHSDGESLTFKPQ